MSEPISAKIKEDCSCLQGTFDALNFQRTHLGGDSFDGEIDLLTCKLCSRLWLHIFYEPKVHDDTARLFYGLMALKAIPAISQGDVPENALAYFASLDWYYCEGTYWSNRGIRVPFKRSGKIILF